MGKESFRERTLPKYTKGEEIFNMVSHIVGGVLGIVALVLCVIFSILHKDPYAVVGSFIYGFSIIILYTVSSVYHGVTPNFPIAKRVMQVIDHCVIFILIAGTYTPIVLCSLRRENPLVAWGVFAFVWGVSALGITLNAIDLKKYKRFSIVCYLVIGWCIVFSIKTLISAVGIPGFVFLLLGGVAYSIGAVLYVIGGKRGFKYMHSVFHIFVVIGTVLQFFTVFFYVI